MIGVHASDMEIKMVHVLIFCAFFFITNVEKFQYLL